MGAKFDPLLGALRTTDSSGTGSPTNLSNTPAPTTVTINSSSGTGTALTAADSTNAGVFLPTEKTKLTGIATGATANSSDAVLEARANHTGTQVASTISDFSTAADARISAAAGVSIASLTAGKIPSSQIPAIGLVSVQTANSQVAQLALTTQEGDVVVRTDTNVTYMRNAGVSGTMTDFTLLNTPTAPVTSVNSQTGVVVLSKTDVGLSNVDNTSDVTKNAAAVSLTNKNLTGAGNTFPTFNQNTTGSAASLSGNIPESQVTNLVTDLAAKQATLVSGTNIKTINSTSLLGSGDIVISGGSAPDATTTTKGSVQLAGDLAGTAAAPTVPALAGKLSAASNLADVLNPATSRANLQIYAEYLPYTGTTIALDMGVNGITAPLLTAAQDTTLVLSGGGAVIANTPGGAVNIASGASTGEANGSNINIATAAATGTGNHNGGDVVINTQPGTGTGRHGQLRIYNNANSALAGFAVPITVNRTYTLPDKDGTVAMLSDITGGSGITRSINTITTAVTAGGTASVDYVYNISTGGTLTMPTAVGNTNEYKVKNILTTYTTVASTSAQTFDGGTLTLSPNQAIILVSDGANWRIY